MMNLLGSHDTPRIFEICKGDVKRWQLAIIFQMCFIGAPHIYYGDEIAMQGGKDRIIEDLLTGIGKKTRLPAKLELSIKK